MVTVSKKTKTAIHRGRSGSSVESGSSRGSDDSRPHSLHSSTGSGNPLPPPVLVYHESARSIVFRDHLRRAVGDAEREQQENENDDDDAVSNEIDQDDHYEEHISQSFTELNILLNPEKIVIEGFTPNIVPLPHLELGTNDEFAPLLGSDKQQRNLWTNAEIEVVEMLENQQAVVKTIKNSDWTEFLHRFKSPHAPKGRYPDNHNDIPAHEGFPFNSFVSSTSLLPTGGIKMRCYGASAVYTTGVVFALPHFENQDEEKKAAEETRTWTWPSGYSAKTEFNINSKGELINGRQEAIVPFSTLREYNNDYLTKQDYMVAGRIIKGGLKTVPYNEVFVRIGGPGRIVDGQERSFNKGLGLPVALFVRTATFGHLISLLRTRARLHHVWGEKHVHGIPLLLISPELGIRVLTEKLQHELLKIASRSLNPFQNPLLHKTTIDNTDEKHLETKVEELIDLDETIREMLTPEECVRIAGGFGATDESIAQILKDAMIQDKESQKEENESHKLQDIVNEGLASAVRSGDYYTSRQLLILYSLVASEGHQIDVKEKSDEIETWEGKTFLKKRSLESDTMLMKRRDDASHLDITKMKSHLPPPPPPPPLDTDRLRSATNSDGLLAVLGAAQILKAMRDGSAKKRTEESFLAVEEWVEHGEQSMAFRLASWRDQRAAQHDLEIAFQRDSNFMAFVSNKAISNRKTFANQLREATKQTDFTDVRFLTTIYEMTSRMHSPCLRLELLQYVLGLDNRYSIAHVKRSVELAATCLSLSANASSE